MKDLSPKYSDINNKLNYYSTIVHQIKFNIIIITLVRSWFLYIVYEAAKPQVD